MYHVYILASRRHGTQYIGVTNSLRKRLEQHRNGEASFVKPTAFIACLRRSYERRRGDRPETVSGGSATGRSADRRENFSGDLSDLIGRFVARPAISPVVLSRTYQRL